MKKAITVLLLLAVFSSFSTAEDFRIVDLQVNPSILYVGEQGSSSIISVLVKNNTANPATSLDVSLKLVKDGSTVYSTTASTEIIQPGETGTAMATFNGAGTELTDLPAGVYALKANLYDPLDTTNSLDFFEKSMAVSRAETRNAASNVPEMPLEFAVLALAGVLSILYFKSLKQ